MPIVNDDYRYVCFSGTMLTIVLLMRALDPLKHEVDTEKYLEKLSEIDHYRKEYYRDLGKQYSVAFYMEINRQRKVDCSCYLCNFFNRKKV